MKRPPGQPKDDVRMRPAMSIPATSGSLAVGLPLSVLTTAMCLSLWVAFGSLVLAVIDGLGADPVRRLGVGTVLVLGAGLALWWRRRVCALLGKRPWLVL